MARAADPAQQPTDAQREEARDAGSAAAAEKNAGKDPIHIRVVDLHKSYNGSPVLKGVNLEALRGQINVVIGGSGAGKTVLLRQLISLEKPDKGQVLIDGEDLVPMNDVQLNMVRRKFGMVFQGSALFDSMTVFDNVAFPLREHTKMPEKEIRPKVIDRLSDLGLNDVDRKMPGELSGGMRKRVGVARALMLEPEILIYDEPTTGLDPVLSRSVDDLIIDMQRRYNVTSVVISHDMATVFRIGHRVSMLYKGQIVATGTPEEILQLDDPVVVEFLKSSGIQPSALEMPK
jgi:phospholipid/cholesterol/gamma-HCH transport system ATP-binding protein